MWASITFASMYFLSITCDKFFFLKTNLSILIKRKDLKTLLNSYILIWKQYFGKEWMELVDQPWAVGTGDNKSETELLSFINIIVESLLFLAANPDSGHNNNQFSYLLLCIIPWFLVKMASWGSTCIGRLIGTVTFLKTRTPPLFLAPDQPRLGI